MKRIVSCLVGVLLLSACSHIEQSVPEDIILDGDIVEKVVFDVLPIKDGDDPETKASAVPSADGKTVGFAWELDDMVGIYPDKGSQIYFKIEDGAGSSSASFDGGGWALKQNSTYVSYYPFVADFFLSRDAIPISFSGQKQVGTTPPFSGARYVLASAPATSENGVLRFTYNTLNTIINVNATLPAGTYTKASLTVDEPLFKEEGTFSLDNMEIVGTKFSNTLEIELENVALTEEGTIPIYIMSAPVDLSGKDVVVRIQSSEGKTYKCTKNPSKEYLAGTRYGLTCDKMVEELVGNISFADSEVKRICVENWDTDGDGELSYSEAATVEYVASQFQTKPIVSFEEFQFFTGLKAILTATFSGCENLRAVIIPEGVKSVGEMAFINCSSLSSVSLPNTLERIWHQAFKNCSSLASISIPESVAKIDESAFNGCACLESVVLPEALTSISSGTFYGCTNLSFISIPKGVSSIGGSAFRDCSSLSSISIPEGVASISSYTFYGCTNLTSVSIPSTIKYISDYAFMDCTSLTSINLPVGLIKIYSSVFENCSDLSSIILPSSLETLGSHAFAGCSSLITINVPDRITSLESGVFADCVGLHSLVIPENVTSIGNYAFAGCRSLASIIIPAGVSAIGMRAFEDCNSLISIIIPESLTSIKQSTFAGCKGLSSIIIPASVAIIDDNAFSGCTGLNSIMVKATTPPTGTNSDRNMFSNTNDCPIFVPAESLEAYKSAWSYYADRIQAIQEINGHAYVDMGNGLKWATMNVGASSPEEYGDYFAWGETIAKTSYSWSSYKWGLGTSLSKYTRPDGLYLLESEDDAATINWGSTWRMPTDAEWTWLRENCTWTWTSDYNGSGIAGCIITSNIQGYQDRSIFLPAAGKIWNGDWVGNVGSYAWYRSNGLGPGAEIYARNIEFSSSTVKRNMDERCDGEPVRPVSD